MNRPRTQRLLLILVTAALAVAVAGCSSNTTDNGARQGTPQNGAPTTGAAAPSPAMATEPAKPVKHYPKGPPMLLDSIAPLNNTTVGVAMPISIVFTTPVKTSARARIEENLHLTTSTPVRGAWHWFGDRRVDFRPKKFWTSGTVIDLDATLNHIGDGYGRYGTHTYSRHITIGADVRTHVYADQHKTVVTRNGKVIRTMGSNTGSPTFPSWDGTMAVVNKEATHRMTSCSVQIACSPSDPNFYDLVLPWDVRISYSGTFLHYSPADPHPGNGFGSHGCVHLSWEDAKWFYNLSKQGDPVTITGSPRGKAAGDNGYADYNVTWSDWLTASGMGAFTTATA